jgi:hypothetical protein
VTALILLCALAAEEPMKETPHGNEPVIEAPGEINGWHFAGVPIASYGSDVGLTLGAALFFYKPIPGYPNEQHSANISLSYATRGPRALDAGGSAQRLFGTPLRAFVNLHAADDPLMPYWGEGARLGGLPTPPGFGTPPEPYRYHDRRIFAAAILRGPIFRALGWHLRVRLLDVDVAEQNALLAASAPPGARGGRVMLGEVGLLYDTRDREIGTRSGVFATAAAFAAPQLGGVSDFAFHGYDAHVRLYVPLWLGATLAMRGLYDNKLAGVPSVGSKASAVPFFERSLYEGLSYNEGLGSAATIRGIARYRIAGDEKMMANVQLRLNLFTTHFAAKTQEFGIDAGVDAGRASQPGFDAVDAAGVAVGLRFIWDRAILFRVEMGRARGGDNTLYVAFGEQF